MNLGAEDLTLYLCECVWGEGGGRGGRFWKISKIKISPASKARNKIMLDKLCYRAPHFDWKTTSALFNSGGGGGGSLALAKSSNPLPLPLQGGQMTCP